MLSRSREFAKSGHLNVFLRELNSGRLWVELMIWELRKLRFEVDEPQRASNQLGRAKAMVQECCGQMAVHKLYEVCMSFFPLGHPRMQHNFSQPRTSRPHPLDIASLCQSLFTHLFIIINSRLSSERYLTHSPTTLFPTVTTHYNTLHLHSSSSVHTSNACTILVPFVSSFPSHVCTRTLIMFYSHEGK
jgi:hypothetical protein